MGKTHPFVMELVNGFEPSTADYESAALPAVLHQHEIPLAFKKQVCYNDKRDCITRKPVCQEIFYFFR